MLRTDLRTIAKHLRFFFGNEANVLANAAGVSAEAFARARAARPVTEAEAQKLRDLYVRWGVNTLTRALRAAEAEE